MSQPLWAIMNATPPSLSISPVYYTPTSHLLSCPQNLLVPVNAVWFGVFDSISRLFTCIIMLKLFLLIFTCSVKVDVRKTVGIKMEYDN